MNFIFQALKYILPINKYSVSGIILMILGFLLIPFLIGIPIVILGVALNVFGIFWHYFKLFRIDRKIREELKGNKEHS